MSQKDPKKTAEQFIEEYNNSPERKIELKEKLLRFGIIVPEEELDSIKIEKEGHSLIIVRNLKTGIRTITNIMGRMHFESYYNDYIDQYLGALIRREHPSNTTVEDTYYSPTDGACIDDLLKDQQELQKCTTLVRAYRNFATKYGTYCILVEDTLKNVRTPIIEPGFRIALYKKNFLPSENSSSIDNNKDCIFELKLRKDKTEEYSFCGNAHGNQPPNYVVKYDPIPGSENEYLYSSFVKSNSFCGLIVQNGSIDVFNTCRRQLPMSFDTLNRKYAFTDDEETPHTSKAYFAIRDNALSVLKDNNVITIKCLIPDFIRGWKVSSEEKIKSQTYGPFTREDIEEVIRTINEYELSREFIVPVIRSLTGYVRIHKDNDLSKGKKFTLEGKSFEQLAEIIQKEEVAKLSERVEKGLAVLSDTFAAPIYNLLGINKEEFKKICLRQ